jgi:outer membrane protein
MELLKMSLSAMALTFVLTAGPALAQPLGSLDTPAAVPSNVEGQAAPQTPPAGQTPPVGQKPPATQPPATQPPATQPSAPQPPPQPPAPFPQGAKIAFVNFQTIAQASTAGREASKKLADLNTKKVSEINDKQKQLQAMQSKLKDGAAVLSESARAQLEKDIDKGQRDIQFAQQNAQAEMQELQNDLQSDFQQKLFPVIKAVAEEKGLHAVFSIGDSGVAYYDPGLDISDEVVKRLDAAKPAPPVKK